MIAPERGNNYPYGNRKHFGETSVLEALLIFHARVCMASSLLTGESNIGFSSQQI